MDYIYKQLKEYKKYEDSQRVQIYKRLLQLSNEKVEELRYTAKYDKSECLMNDLELELMSAKEELHDLSEEEPEDHIPESEVMKVTASLYRFFKDRNLAVANVRRLVVEIFKYFESPDNVYKICKAFLNTFRFNYHVFRDKDFTTSLELLSREIYFTPNMFYENSGVEKQFMENFYTMFADFFLTNKDQVKLIDHIVTNPPVFCIIVNVIVIGSDFDLEIKDKDKYGKTIFKIDEVLRIAYELLYKVIGNTNVDIYETLHLIPSEELLTNYRIIDSHIIKPNWVLNANQAIIDELQKEREIAYEEERLDEYYSQFNRYYELFDLQKEANDEIRRNINIQESKLLDMKTELINRYEELLDEEFEKGLKALNKEETEKLIKSTAHKHVKNSKEQREELAEEKEELEEKKPKIKRPEKKVTVDVRNSSNLLQSQNEADMDTTQNGSIIEIQEKLAQDTTDVDDPQVEVKNNDNKVENIDKEEKKSENNQNKSHSSTYSSSIRTRASNLSIITDEEELKKLSKNATRHQKEAVDINNSDSESKSGEKSRSASQKLEDARKKRLEKEQDLRVELLTNLRRERREQEQELVKELTAIKLDMAERAERKVPKSPTSREDVYIPALKQTSLYMTRSKVPEEPKPKTAIDHFFDRLCRGEPRPKEEQTDENEESLTKSAALEKEKDEIRQKALELGQSNAKEVEPQEASQEKQQINKEQTYTATLENKTSKQQPIYQPFKQEQETEQKPQKIKSAEQTAQESSKEETDETKDDIVRQTIMQTMAKYQNQDIKVLKKPQKISKSTQNIQQVTSIEENYEINASSNYEPSLPAPSGLEETTSTLPVPDGSEFMPLQSLQTTEIEPGVNLADIDVRLIESEELA